MYNSNPFLSVIIPIYNVENYLDKCLTTCLIHDERIEYILVDDGSTDYSFEIAKKYKKIYKNIILVKQRNKGVSAARNAGLKQAKGTWIYFVDSDDFVSKNFMNNMINLLLAHGNEVAVFNLPVKKFTNGNAEIMQDGSNRRVDANKFILKLLQNNRQFGVWSYIFRRDCLGISHGWFREDAFFEDEYFIPPILISQNKVFEVSHNNLGFYYYRTRKSSFTLSKPTLRKVEDQVRAETFRNKYFADHCQDAMIKNAAKDAELSIYFMGIMGASYLKNKKLHKYYLNKFRDVQKKVQKNTSLKQKLKIVLSYFPNRLISYLYYRINTSIKYK